MMMARWDAWLLVTAAALSAGTLACSKGGAKPPPHRDGGVVATYPDGAPIVGTAWTTGVPPGMQDPTLRACRVALHTGWGPAAGPLSGLPLMMRTYRAHGTREEVLRIAKEKICGEAAVPLEQCTDDKFEKSMERCDGDPRPAHAPLSPDLQPLADRIRAGATPIDAGATPVPDAGIPDRHMPAYGPDGEQLIY
ncbi:MAG: hypothetical protein HY905_24670 [Deltaproteobacteria bacterium]|nr:hypothetical protein [Deltaproteobacteria bacterium]